MPQLTFDLVSLLPVPNALPAPAWILHTFLFAGFVVHILAMNAVVGLSCIFFCQRVFLSKKVDVIRELACPFWTFLPKGLALVVNFGVVPLLFIQATYGYLAYNGDILMAVWWLSVMMVVMLAYYGLYIATSTASVPVGVGNVALFVSVTLLLFNAFIFVNKGTLIQDPASWLNHAVNPYGLFINFADPQLLPRYLHMIVASLAVGGVCLSLYSNRKVSRLEKYGASAKDLRYAATQENNGLLWYFYATSLQVVIGSWFLLSLPTSQLRIFMGGDKFGTALFMVGLIFLLISLVASRQKKLKLVVASLLITVLSMAGMRSHLRTSMLADFASPASGKLDIWPFAMFIGSTLLTVLAIVYMFKVFATHKAQSVIFRNASAPAQEED